MAKKKYQIGIIAQVAILFVIGSLVTGVITYFTQRFYAEGNVQKQTKTLGADIAANVVNSVREYPAYEWLLHYWHAHSAELDIEYDVEFTTESTATERKCRTLQARHPELLVDYAAADAIDALPPEDQKLYAEIVYSWLITRINDIARSYKTDYLFCLLTDEPYDRQFFLFSAAASGAERGSKYEQAYTLGTTVTVTPAQQAAMRQACQMTSQLADAGDYVDYYSYFEALDGHDILIGMTFNLKAIWGDVSEQTVIGTMLALSIQTWLSLICLALIYIFVLRPLKSVQRDIQLYKETKDSTRLTALNSGNEIGQLSEDVVSLAKEIDHHLLRIETITAEKERIDTELGLAARIQASAIPNTFPPFPGRKEFEIYATMDPAREVSGDFYDFFMIDDDHLALSIADVSGKGVPAALFMMVSMILIQAAAKQERSPAKALDSVNAQICAHNPQRMFISVWLGILEISTGQLTAANAGHEYPVLQKHGQPYQLLKDEHSFVIGGLPNITIDEYTLRLSPGDRLFVYTDGVPEASNADKELFGLTRMLEALNQEPDAGPERVLANVQKAVDGFVRQAEQFDDLTMMCVEYKGPAPKESEIGS